MGVKQERMMKKIWGLMLIALMVTTSAVADAEEETNYKNATKEFKGSDRAASFFKSAYGYAIFPTVGKGGFGLGGAHGDGRVFINGKHVADASLSQFTIGFQVGGQAFSQIMFFEDESAFKEFKSGNFELGAQASAVAIKAGASADVDYDRGIIIFTVAKGGLMYEASVGGQSFDYEPLD